MKKILCFSAVLGLLMGGTSFAALEVPPVIDLPGTQPEEVSGFESPGRCDNCHDGYDAATPYSQEPAFGWRGSAMGNAGRDPIFWATVAIAEQDFDGAGDLCIRCHSAGGWIEGRSTPTDGSGLAASDDNGIDCDTCHRSTNPDNSEHQGVMFEPFVANFVNSDNKLEGFFGSGMLSVWDGKEKLGPYRADDALAKHQRMQSAFHRSEDFCGTCHDVSNSAVGHFAPNFGAQDGAVANVITDGSRTHSEPDHILTPFLGEETYPAYVGLNNPPYAYGIVERTFSEYKSSAFTGMPISAFTNLPTDLQVAGGALALAANSAAGDSYDDGTPRYFTCQTCHMRATNGVGANKSGIPVRHDLAMHDLTGGNYWLYDLVIYQDDNDLLRLGGGLTASQKEAMTAGTERAKRSLESTINMQVTGDTITLTNLTGHKAITGYPEGRRMWLNIKWYDENNTEMTDDEYGAYGDLKNPDETNVTFSYTDFSGQEVTFTPRSILHPESTKIYEVQPAISQEWAAVLTTVAPTVYNDIEIGYDRITGDPAGKISDLAGQDPGTYQKTFHFVLNNKIASDNRIPPYGFSKAKATKRNALPEPSSQYSGGTASYPGPTGETLIDVYEYWDDIDINALKPAGAVYADITLYYQGTSWEYVQFLWQANKLRELEPGSFLADEGVNMLDAWVKTGMVEPFAMASAEWGTPPVCEHAPEGPYGDATCSDGADNDCDDLTDAADPDCQQTVVCSMYDGDRAGCTAAGCSYVGKTKTCQ